MIRVPPVSCAAQMVVPTGCMAMRQLQDGTLAALAKTGETVKFKCTIHSPWEVSWSAFRAVFRAKFLLIVLFEIADYRIFSFASTHQPAVDCSNEIIYVLRGYSLSLFTCSGHATDDTGNLSSYGTSMYTNSHLLRRCFYVCAAVVLDVFWFSCDWCWLPCPFLCEG